MGRACLLVLLLVAGAASAATFTVTSTADTDDGTCDADCTLREAINAANGNAGADIIDFSVPADSIITLGSSLANIDGNLGIDGTTATNLTVSDSGGFPIFQVDTGTTTVSGVTVTGLDLAIATDANVTFDVTGTDAYVDDISGGGSVTKDGPGLLVLFGANSYSGGTVVEAGTLGATALNLPPGGTVTLNGSSILILDEFPGAENAFSGVIKGTGSLQKLFGGTLVLTGANSYEGGTSVAGGTLKGDSDSLQGDIDISSGATLVFDQAIDGSYDGEITGDGDLEKSGGGTLTVTEDSSTFTGTTTLSAGGLQLTGTLGGNVVVATTALLGGTGEIGGPLTSNGTVSPGPPGEIGTLRVQGDAVLQDGSFLEVDIGEGGADLLEVTNTATNNGAEVVVQLGEGDFETLVEEEILSSAGLAGAPFAPPSDDFAFLELDLWDDGSSVFLSVVDNGAPFETFAETRNQRAVARALDDSEGDPGGDYEEVLRELRRLSESELPPAFDQMSGEPLTMLFTPRLAARDRFSRMVAARLRGFASRAPYAVPRSGDSGGGGLALAPLPRPGRPGFPLGAAGAAGVGGTFLVRPAEGESGPGGWLDGYGIFGEVDGSGQADVHYEVYGTSLGIDFRPSESWIVGAAGGYARIDASLDGRDGEAEGNTGRGALYAAYAHDFFTLGVSAGGGYGDFETEREIDFGPIDRRAKADFDGWDVSAHGEVGITALSLGGVHIDPIASLDYTRLEQAGFEETGAGSLDLDTESEIVNSLVSGVGTRIHGTFRTGPEWLLTPELRVAWTHEFEDTDRRVRAAFSGASTGGSFSVEGAELSRDSLVAGAGYVISGPQGLHLYAGYDFRWNPDGLEHGAGIGLQFAW